MTSYMSYKYIYWVRPSYGVLATPTAWPRPMYGAGLRAIHAVVGVVVLYPALCRVMAPSPSNGVDF